MSCIVTSTEDIIPTLSKLFSKNEYGSYRVPLLVLKTWVLKIAPLVNYFISANQQNPEEHHI